MGQWGGFLFFCAGRVEVGGLSVFSRVGGQTVYFALEVVAVCFMFVVVVYGCHKVVFVLLFRLMLVMNSKQD